MRFWLPTPNGVIIERDELIGLLKSLERPGQEGARAFYLEGWTGDGSCESDRIGRGNVRIDGFCLSILGTIQPGPLGTYLGEALRGGTGDDGLMQRFQMAVWPDDPGAWQVVDRWPDSDSKNAAYAVYQRFDELPASSIGELPGAFDSNTTPFLRFDAEAQDRFYAWMVDRENHLRSGAEHPAVESHLTKYRKLVPALALSIHLAESDGGPVTLDAVTRAVGWADYLESHARRIYSRGIHPATAHARALAQRIEQGDVATGFTVLDVYHGHHWSLLADAEQVQLAVDELIELGWLRTETLNTPGRPKVVRSTRTKAELTFDTLDAAYRWGLDLLADQPERIDALMFVGLQRALMYRMMICTGLRKSELASITVGQTHLDGQYPCLELLAKDEKAGRGAMIPLRADLVEALRAYIDNLQTRAGEKALRHDTHLFPMPKDMIRVFNRDLTAASISKRDERNRVVDLHALQHTFGTHLARAGVAPRVAMAAMRHSSLELTMNVYTDPALLDVAGAVEALPAFGFSDRDQHRSAATA